MISIKYLSDEIICIILSNENVNIEDIVSFTSTCKRFHDVVDENNLFWKKKLFQRWPYLKKVYDTQICEVNVNFKEQVKRIMKCRKKLWHYLSNMSQKHYYKDDLADADMRDINVLFHIEKDTYLMNYYFLMAELVNLLTQSPEQSNYDLTQRYYAKKLLPYLLRCHLKDTWQTFINYPFKMQTLEQAASIIAQWFQPLKYVSYSHVKASLDNITQQVLECLKKEHPKHPIFSTSIEQFTFWEQHNIDNDQWNITEGQHIINHIQKTLYEDLGFSGTHYSENIVKVVKLEDSLVDCVLKNKVGNSVCMAVIFHAVARRLGICCTLITFPCHLFLIWKPKYDSLKSEKEDNFYIDVINNGAIKSSRECPKVRGAKKCPIENFNTSEKIDPAQMMLLMIHNLKLVNCYDNSNYFDRNAQNHSLLELQHLIEPNNIEIIEQLGFYYAQRGMNLSDLLTVLHNKRIFHEHTPQNVGSLEAMYLEKLIDKFRAYDMRSIMYFDRKVPKPRTNQIKFSVGEFVKFHDKLNRHYTGVIIGWHTHNLKSNELYDFANYILLEAEAEENTSCSNFSVQPFYIIFSEEGCKYYTSQDNIIETIAPKWINHEEIGRYFCRFEKTHYVPNQVLQKLYPLS